MAYHVENVALGTLEKQYGGTPAECIQAYLDDKHGEGLELVSQGSGPAGLLFIFKGSGGKKGK
jgi:hypothetical protein